jgi:hypothetical protein
LGFFLILTVAATLVNPETFRIFAYVRAVATNPASQALVLSGSRPAPNELAGIILFYAPFFITLLVLLGARRRRARGSCPGAHVLDPGLSAVRNGVWFALIAAPVVARYFPTIDFSALIIRSPFSRWEGPPQLARRSSGNGGSIRYWLNRQIAVLMLTIVVW